MSLRHIILVLALIVSVPVYADFSTYSKNWPNDAATVNENVSKPPPVQEQASVVKPVPVCTRISENKRVYVKFGINANTTEIRNIRNQSYSPLANKPIVSDYANLNDYNWEVGVGTKIDPVRFELEYIHHRLVNYNPVPLVVGNFASLSSEVTNQSLLINIFYDFSQLQYVKPYVGALTGFVWNKARSILQGGGVGNGIAKNNSKFGTAWGFSIGMRVPFKDRWYGYLGYRYMGLSKVIWKDSTSTMKLQGQYVYKGFDLGVQVIL